jgi:hypothetical protein
VLCYWLLLSALFTKATKDPWFLTPNSL